MNTNILSNMKEFHPNTLLNKSETILFKNLLTSTTTSYTFEMYVQTQILAMVVIRLVYKMKTARNYNKNLAKNTLIQ